MLPPHPDMEIVAKVIATLMIIFWYPVKAVVFFFTDWWDHRGVAKRYKKFIKNDPDL